MASGVKKVKVFIAVTHNEVPIILDIPCNDFDITMLSDIFLEDEPFINTEIIPKRVGMYELECEMYWDDGDNAFFERADGDFTFKIVSVKGLCQI
jgi:hypothetical protein